MAYSFGTAALCVCLCLLVVSGDGKSLANLKSENKTQSLSSTTRPTTSTDRSNGKNITLKIPSMAPYEPNPSTDTNNVDTKKSDHWMSVIRAYPWVMIVGGVAVVLLIAVVILSVVIAVLCRKIKANTGYRSMKDPQNRAKIPIPRDSPSITTSTTQLDSPTAPTQPAGAIESLKYDLPFNSPEKIGKADMKQWFKPQTKAKPKPPARKPDLGKDYPIAVDKDDYLLPKTVLETPQRGRNQELGKTKDKTGKSVAKSRSSRAGEDDVEPKLDDTNYLVITHSDPTEEGSADLGNNNKGKKQDNTTFKVPLGMQKGTVQDKLKKFQDLKNSKFYYDIPHGSKITKSLSQGNVTELTYKVPTAKETLPKDSAGYVAMDMYRDPSGSGNSSGSASDVFYDVPFIGKDKPKRSASQGCLDNQNYNVPAQHDPHCYENHRPVIFR